MCSDVRSCSHATLRYQYLFQPTTITIRNDALFAGDEIKSHSGHLVRTFPISRGAIMEWSHMEHIWRYMYNKLGRNPTDQAVILAEPPLNPKYNREKIAEVNGEKYYIQLFIYIFGLMGPEDSLFPISMSPTAKEL